MKTKARLLSGKNHGRINILNGSVVMPMHKGGTLYIGIDDNGNVTGLEEKIVKKLLEDIPNNKAKRSCKTPI